MAYLDVLVRTFLEEDCEARDRALDKIASILKHTAADRLQGRGWSVDWAEDLAEEVIADYLLNPDFQKRLRESERPGKILYNAIKTVMERRKNRPAGDVPLEEIKEDDGESDTSGDSTPTMNPLVQEKIVRAWRERDRWLSDPRDSFVQEIVQALRDLGCPEPHIEAFILHFEQGWTFQEIADLVGVSVATTWNWIQKSLKCLRTVYLEPGK